MPGAAVLLSSLNPSRGWTYTFKKFKEDTHNTMNYERMSFKRINSWETNIRLNEMTRQSKIWKWIIKELDISKKTQDEMENKLKKNVVFRQLNKSLTNIITFCSFSLWNCFFLLILLSYIMSNWTSSYLPILQWLHL